MQVGKKRIIPGSLAPAGYHRVDIQSEDYAWFHLVFPLVSQGKTILRIKGTVDNYIIQTFMKISDCSSCIVLKNLPQMLNVWYIYLHLPSKLPKCR